MANNRSTLVTILTSAHLHRIQIAQQVLANNGIKSFIIDGNIDLVYTRSLIEGIRLQINAEDIDAATPILRNAELLDE